MRRHASSSRIGHSGELAGSPTSATGHVQDPHRRGRRKIPVPRPAQLLHRRRRARTDAAPSLTKRLVFHARPNDVTEGDAAGWTLAQLREPAQKIADRIEAVKASAGQLWKASDRFGNPFVMGIGEGTDTSPRSATVSTLPVPDDFTEHGPPPLITLGPDCPRGSLEVTRGTVRVRFADPAATVTTEVSDTPPPPQNKPLVIVRPRPDRAPDVQVRGGKAVVRVEGWDDSEGTSSGA